MKIITIVTVLSLFSLFSCQNKSIKNDENEIDIEKFEAKYNINDHFTETQKDSLMVTIVTFMGKKAPQADHTTRFSNKFRSYYEALSQSFTMCYLNKQDNDNLYHYYIIRPARSIDGNRRGAGGTFRINHDHMIYDFEEIFNTPVNTVDSLKLIGATLFQEMITSGNIEKYRSNKLLIEWPDDRIRYHKERNEWRYDHQE